MGKYTGRIACYLVQAACTVWIAGTLVAACSWGAGSGHAVLPLAIRFLPTLVHLVASCVISGILIHAQKTTVGSDAQAMPLLLVAMTLLDVRSFPALYAVTGRMWVPLEIVGHGFQTGMLATLLLAMLCMVYQTEINTKTISQGVTVAVALSLIIGAIAPVSPNSTVYLHGAFITGTVMRMACYAIGATGLLVLLASVLQENVSNETMVKCLAYMADIIAVVLLVPSYSFLRDLASSLLSIVSLVVLLLVTRARRVWA